MKTAMKTLLVAAAAVLTLSGCAGLEVIQKAAGGLAEKQCEQPLAIRKAERVAAFLALDRKAYPELHCPGDPEFDRMSKAADVFVSALDDVKQRDYGAVVSKIINLAVEDGIELSDLDYDGECFQLSSGKFCPKVE